MRSKERQNKCQANFNLNNVYYAKMSDVQSTASKANSITSSQRPIKTQSGSSINKSKIAIKSYKSNSKRTKFKEEKFVLYQINLKSLLSQLSLN